MSKQFAACLGLMLFSFGCVASFAQQPTATATPAGSLLERAKAVRTAADFDALLKEMQKNVKTFHAKGNFGEQWVLLPPPNHRAPGYRVVSLDNGRKVSDERWCNGQLIWEWGYDTQGNSFFMPKITDLAKAVTDGISMDFIMGFLMGPMILSDAGCHPATGVPAFQWVGEEAGPNGVRCFHFKGTIAPYDRVMIRSLVADLWVDAESGLLRQCKTEYDVTGKGKMEDTMTVSEIVINPPDIQAAQFNYTPPPGVTFKDGNAELLQAYQKISFDPAKQVVAKCVEVLNVSYRSKSALARANWRKAHPGQMYPDGLDEGRYPDSLEEVKGNMPPQMADAILKDPHRPGQLLVYKSSDGKSFLLYSVGPNGQDENGGGDDIAYSGQGGSVEKVAPAK